jgi:hypothetical protein
MDIRNVFYFVFAALAWSSIACGNNNSSLYPVVGRVTYKGEPATGATVFFYRQGVDPMNEHMIMGTVQGDGSFELVCGSLGKGAPAGEYDVAIEWKHVSGQSRGQPRHGDDKLKGRYADPKHRLIHVTVKAERNELASFELVD